MLKKSGIFGLLFLAIAAQAEGLVARTQVMMGTYASISLPKEQTALSNSLFARLKEVELSLSSYDPSAEIYRLNRDHEVSISRDTYEALRLCSRYYKETQGYFDITVGSITRGLFHFGEAERVPHANELKKAAVNFKGLHFNEEWAWSDEGIVVDLGGMGKGFGVDKAAELLRAQGVKKGIVALSGDIFCLHACEMAVQDPFSENILASFMMAQHNTAISTSGNYRRFVKSREYNHLINPKTHSSQQEFASITLLSAHLGNSDLDAYATAASVMPKEKALRFLDGLRKVGYLILTNDKKVYINGAFRGLSREFRLFFEEGREKKAYIEALPLRFQSPRRRGL
ncbi:MAG: FAD:protein FMN transferase [Campylobacterales bacterium]|nr:FAD:protein FMN transferase [Campylobacterales bacterium]